MRLYPLFLKTSKVTRVIPHVSAYVSSHASRFLINLVQQISRVSTFKDILDNPAIGI